jgi:predicted ribosomally synthesized peptide with SipW-like signal peptide
MELPVKKKALLILMLLVTVLSLAGVGSSALLSDSEQASFTFTAGTWGAETQTVTIYVKQGDWAPINPGSNGVIKVFILTDLDFDATYIDPDTVLFGRGKAVPERFEITDINNDLRRDMVLTFDTEDTGIRSGDTEVELTGFTVDNKEFKGVGTVRTVP